METDGLNGTSLTSILYYDKRLQPCRISITTGSGVPTNCADTASGSIGNILDLAYGFNLGTADNGNVAVITNLDGWPSIKAKVLSRTNHPSRCLGHRCCRQRG